MGKQTHADNDFRETGVPNANDSLEGTCRKINAQVSPGSGSRIIESADGAVTGRFKQIIAMGGDVVLDSVIQSTFEPADALDGRTLPEGFVLDVMATSITVSSGTLIAYAL